MQSPKSKLELISELIRAIANVMWPLATLAIAVLYREDIHGLLLRLRKGKFFGQEIELEHETKAVEKQVEAAEQAEPSTPVLEPANVPVQPKLPAQDDATKVRDFLREAGQDKRLALLAIWIDIEEQLRILVAVQGLLSMVSRYNIRDYVKILSQRHAITPATAQSLLSFNDLRNRIVHGDFRNDTTDSDLIALIDSGLRMLELLRAIPRETYKVATTVPIFEDRAAQHKYEGVAGVILDVTEADGRHRQSIFPTTRHYTSGQTVSWEWNMKRAWGPAWYVEPRTNAITQAWSGAAEFIGRPISEIR